MTTQKIIEKKKNQEKIVALAAYDYQSAQVLDEQGIDLILVGDSLGMVLLGYENTLPVTMDEMIHHTKAVARGTSKALVVADMPFMSYQASIEEALRNAGRFIKEAGAQAVKIEGGVEMVETAKALVQNGIPVLGHIGLRPQEMLTKGGYRVQGKNEEEQSKLIEDAKALEATGAFALVLEGMPAELAKEITSQIEIPTIGIGAGPDCDGQILVLHDIIGLGQRPKFVKVYADFKAQMKEAVKNYQNDVKEGNFPDLDHSY